ncbi:MAG: hypothetical protein M3R14_16180 [Acidobacteriota bacterium]|nr:hypothetical protein [Acidobacteriota bacterium]
MASWIWNSGRLKFSFEDFPCDLFLVFLIFVGLTIVYFFILRLSKNYAWRIRAQFFHDALLIIWLFWRTGDANTFPVILSLRQHYRIAYPRAANNSELFAVS